MASEMGGAAASAQMGGVAQQSLQRGMNIPPTIEIRPGYLFNVMVTTDLVLQGLTGTEAEGSKVENGAEKKTLTSSYLTLTIGGHLKKEIDAYVEYALRVGGQEIDPAEVVRLMLWHFLETNEGFSAWRSTRIY